MRIVLTLFAIAVLAGCASRDYGADPVYSTIPSVAGCPESGDVCAKGRG